MSESQTFNQAFEANLAFEEKVREDLTRLQEENTEAWQHLVDELKTIYTPTKKASKPKATPKTKAAPKAKKAA